MAATLSIRMPHATGFAPTLRCGYDARALPANEKVRMSEDGLEAIFMANRSALLRFFAARGWQADAEDLLQELWIKARATDSGPIGEPRAYLFRMADNLLVDRRRADLRRSRRDDQWTDATRGTVEDISDAPSIERILIARDQLRRVDREIDALGERTALIFRSFRIEGMGQRDIATMTGISVSAVEKHLQKAYRALVKINGQANVDSPTRQRRGGEGQDE